MKGPTSATTQVRALLWEESRVAGAITATCFAVAMLMLLSYYRIPGAWTRDDFTTHFAALGVPILTSLLIILNPDSSGHLVGGFSKRVLRLPVQIPITVAVSLLSRALLIFTMSSGLLAIAATFFEGAPGFEAVCLITLVYLAAQLIDWMRGPLRGLSTVVVLYLLALFVLWLRPSPGLASVVFFPMGLVAWLAKTIPFGDVPPFVYLILAIVVVYAIAVPMVHLDRVGRRYGVPEIWEWHKAISISGPVRTRTFNSPMAAQIWFEFHRARWVMPLIFLLYFAIIFVISWVEVHHNRNRGDDHNAIMRIAGLLIFLGVLLAAAAHGVQTRVLGLRRHARMSGYEYLQPLTDCQFATARVIVGASLLIPVILAALALHFGFPGRYALTELLPAGLRAGIISMRDAVWILLSRGIVTGILAWSLLAIGTRAYQRTLMLVLLLFALSGLGLYLHLGTERMRYFASVGFVTVLLITAVWTAAYAWRKGLLSRGAAMGWLIAWALVAWLLRYSWISSWPKGSLTSENQLQIAFTAIGVSALVPLTFLSILLDIRRRRRMTTVRQDTAQHSSRGIRVPAMIAAAITVVFVLWLGWPSTPASVKYRHAKGYPATLQELDDWYVSPADGKNPALDYIAAAQDQRHLSRDFDDYLMITAKPFLNLRHGRFTGERLDSWDRVYLVGVADYERAGPLARHSWFTTEVYWNRVTSLVTPKLIEIGKQDVLKSRYPADFRRGYAMEMRHLDDLRVLGREVPVDALHWVVQGRPDKATDSVIAGIRLSESLANEPVVMSQLTRSALLSYSLKGAEIILNRSTPTDADLVRLQQACDEALRPVMGNSIFARAYIGESTIIGAMSYGDWAFGRNYPIPLRLATSLAYPQASLDLILNLDLAFRFREADKSFFEAEARARLEGDEYYQQRRFLTPLIGFLSSGLSKVDIEKRMQIDVARSAIAVERYRLANKKLPNTLDDLVPNFLPAVPKDMYAGANAPLSYQIRDNGEFVVYGIGRNQIDNGGYPESDGPGRRNDDISMEVAPPSVRMGPQVAEN